MVARGSGHVVGVASVAGYRGLAGAEAHGVTKAGQINLLEGLRAALATHGVSATTVCLGFVGTDLTEGNAFPMPFMIEADQAARSICDGLARAAGDRVSAADGSADEDRPAAAGPGVGRRDEARPPEVSRALSATRESACGSTAAGPRRRAAGR